MESSHRLTSSVPFQPSSPVKEYQVKSFPHQKSELLFISLRIKPKSFPGSTKPPTTRPCSLPLPWASNPTQFNPLRLPWAVLFLSHPQPVPKVKGLESVLPSPQNVLPPDVHAARPPSSRHLFRCCPLRGLPCPAFLFSRALSPSWCAVDLTYFTCCLSDPELLKWGFLFCSVLFPQPRTMPGPRGRKSRRESLPDPAAVMRVIRHVGPTCLEPSVGGNPPPRCLL